MAQEPGFAKRRPLVAAACGRRRRADARGAPGDVARARRRDRPGLRADRGGAERPLPAARGRRAQARLRRQAVSARRRRAPRSRVGRPARRRRPRESSRPRPERLRRLLAKPRGDRRRVRGRLAPDRRRRSTRRGGLLPDRRPDEGHGHLRRRERLPGRDRERPPRARRQSREAAVVGIPDERWGEACLAFVVLAGARHRGGAARALPRPAGALQGAAAGFASSSRCRGTRWTRSSSRSSWSWPRGSRPKERAR